MKNLGSRAYMPFGQKVIHRGEATKNKGKGVWAFRANQLWAVNEAVWGKANGREGLFAKICLCGLILVCVW